MRKIVLALISCSIVHVLLAGGQVVETSLFPDGSLPAGWTVNANGLQSPTYSNRVTQVAFSYAATHSGTIGTLALYASNELSSVEHEVAALNTRTTGAQLDFPDGSDYRSFRIVTNGVALTSFSATWMDTRLATPTNIAFANNTGASFDLSWDAVDGATGYKVFVWTNAVSGASEGVPVWQEGFSNAEATTSSSTAFNGKQHTDNKTDGWTGDKAYRSPFQGVIKIGSGSSAGWLATPPLGSAYADASLAVRLLACVTNTTDSERIPVAIVSGSETNTADVIDDIGTEFRYSYMPISGMGADDKIIVQSPSSTKASGRPVLLLDEIAIVSGYSGGAQVHDVLREETISAAATACTVAGLPPVAVQVSIQALGENEADASESSAAITVDLAHPPPVSQLAVLGSAVDDVGYSESFDVLNGLGSSADWVDGITLPYWQARKGTTAVGTISTSSGTGNKSGGLYAYRGTNKTESASFSLAAAANTSNRLKFGFAVTNDTEGTLFDFEISFIARQWTFSSGRKEAQALHFEYLVTNEVVSVSDIGAWQEVDELRFDAMDHTANSLADAAIADRADYATGSAFSNLSATLNEVQLKRGEVLMFRWWPDPVSNGEVLGIDNLVLGCTASGPGLVLRLAQAIP